MFIYSTTAIAQTTAVANHKTIQIKIDTTLLVNDSLTIIPQSIKIKTKNNLLRNEDIRIDNNKIYLKKDVFEKVKNDTAYISYRTLGINLGKMYYIQDTNALAQAAREVYIAYDLGKPGRNNNAIMPSGLNYDGSYSRGFSIGNRQSLVLNSNLNLQMTGDIGDGIKLRAAISDANIPIQPDGSTQRLNEFDKVFIEISKSDHSLLAGDYELTNPKGYFIRYLKKLKGLKYSNRIKLNNKKKIENSVGFAISKGKFASNKLKVTNGNQGPYKLQGAEGERFLIILSGTEKVYLDGKLLKRGLNNDYIIDYNLAEIRFMPKIMITENSRVLVEFEYSDQNYLRSLQVVNSTYGDSLNNFYINFYNEMDSKTSLGTIELDSIDLMILANAGDNFENNYRSGIRPINQNEITSEQIFYKKRYEPSIMDSVLVYTANRDSAKYIAYFSEVGLNKGSYDIDKTKLLNGRVYKWVGINKGKYEPILKLIPPEKKQLIALGANIKINENTGFKAELSISNQDKNRFSTLNDNDNTGFASYLQMKTKKKFSLDNTIINIKNKAKYEYAGIHFKTLSPYRSPEFSRDWNLKNSYTEADEHILSNDFSIAFSGLELQYRYSGFFRSDKFTGNRHIPSIKYDSKGFSLFAITDILLSNDSLYNTVFLRPKFDISKSFSFLKDTKLGFYFEEEKNDIKLKIPDSLSTTSFYYDKYKFYIATKSSATFNINLFASLRKDYVPIDNDFAQYSDAYKSGIEGNWKVGSISFLSFNLAYRKLNIVNTSINKGQKPESNILGKLHHRLYLFKGGITSGTSMEFGSGQLAKSEFVFIKVKRGEGSYVWIDTDKDEEKDKDEFFIIPGIDSANYVKIIQYNNEFIRANTTMLSNNLKVDAKKIVAGKKAKIYKFISKLSFISFVKLTRQSKSDNKTYFLSLFNDLRDTSLVSYNFSFNGTLFYNRGAPNYDIRLGMKKISNKPVQLEGYTIYGITEYSGIVKYSYKSKLDALTKIALGNKNYDSQFSLNRNYSFDYYQLNQEMNIIYNRNFGTKLVYSFWNKKNKTGEKEKAILHDLSMTIKLLRLKKINFNLSFSYVNIDYNGKENTAVELAMLDGLKQGNNYLWKIKITKRMKNNLDLILNYDGRKTQGNKTIHTAKMQARATF